MWTMFELSEEEVKCPTCGSYATKLYAYAETMEDAEELYEDGDAGMCGECMCSHLAELGYRILPPVEGGTPHD